MAEGATRGQAAVAGAEGETAEPCGTGGRKISDHLIEGRPRLKRSRVLSSRLTFPRFQRHLQFASTAHLPHVSTLAGPVSGR